jgi:hypothetical protein
MDEKKIIIILVAIIAVLAVAVGAMLLQQNTQEPTIIKITSEKSQYEGGKLSLQLTDFNKTGLSKEIVNITITNSKGKVVVDDVVKTNSKGKAKLDLDLKKGKYNVNVTYGGNENYTGNNTTQKLTIKEKVVQTQTASSSSSSSHSSDTYVERTEGGFKYGYKDGRYGFWTPSGNFIEDKSRALAGEDPMEPFMRDGSFNDQL